METILNSYYENNARKLHKMVDRILYKFGGIYEKDRDDFYSIANEVFADIMKRYDFEQPFDGFLYSCLKNKIMSEITRRNCKKRKADRLAVSLDAPMGEKGDCTISTIAGSFDVEAEAFREADALAYKLEQYLARLSRRQKAVLELLSCCYKASEIQELLDMTAKEYMNALEAVRAYENIKYLF